MTLERGEVEDNGDADDEVTDTGIAGDVDASTIVNSSAEYL